MLIHCLLFVIPFNVHNYVYHVRIHMYYSALLAAKHNKVECGGFGASLDVL